MPSLFFYIFWGVFALVGVGLVVQLLLPVGGMRCYDEKRQNCSRAWALLGFGVMIVGTLAFIDTYAQRHAAAEGVIFIPSFIMFWALMVALACIATGLLWRLTWRAGRDDVSEQESTPEERLAMAGNISGESDVY